MAQPVPRKRVSARTPASAAKPVVKRTLDARRDTMDFRDLMFVPTLIEVPTHIPLKDYLQYKVPVLDQGQEGACTGFGLATVANYLLLKRRVVPDDTPVSARMLYEMARRYDEWPGEDYTGSSARGAMKGWHKHGVCAEKDYPYKLRPGMKRGLTEQRVSSAMRRPLGAYFRVNHRDLIAMHSAITEVGVLYATATVHAGWDAPGRDGVIHRSDEIRGGHAFAIVAYDEDGFWLQNSWGKGWGRGGLARLSYDDWLQHGTDVWVARLGAPVVLRDLASTAVAHASTSGQSAAYAYADVRPHIVSLGNGGALKPGGDYGTTAAELQQIFEDDIPRVMGPWPKKRLLLYAHGGLVSEQAAVQRVAEYRPALLAAGVYPLAFVWNSDYWTTLTNILRDAVRRRRPEGFLDAAKDFLLDRLDDALEPLARVLTGKAAWSEMKENALGASDPGHGADLVLQHVLALAQRFPALEVHLVGHSAGSIVNARLVQRLAAARRIERCTLWAPACRIDLFKSHYLPAIRARAIGRFTLFALSDKAEQDDHVARIYNKSLLYLVSNAFEDPPRHPLRPDGVPILGMEKFIRQDAELQALFASGTADLVIAPNDQPPGSPGASAARHHGDFDDDARTVAATLARIAPPAAAPHGARPPVAAAVAETIEFRPSESSLRERRKTIDDSTRPVR